MFFDRVVTRGADATPFLEQAGQPPLTYAEVRQRVEQMAAALLSLGVKPGDRVAAQVEKTAEAVVLYLGTVAAGGVFLPLNTAYTATELDYFLGDAEPRVFVCDPAHRDAIAALANAKGVTIETLDAAGRGSLYDKRRAASAGAAPVARGADDLAAILYTSGTTGRSKGAMLTHQNLVSNAETLAALWAFTSQDRLIHALPIYHTHGLFVACNVTLVAGGTLIFLPKFDLSIILAEMPRATAMMGVPTFYTRLLDTPAFTKDVAKNMRLFVSGSAPLLAETHAAWKERTGHAILERYGMTETNMNCSNPYDGERRAGTVGFPLPGIDLRIADPDSGSSLGTEQVGMIEVKGPNVFKGYWRNPEKTAIEFRKDGFFITGDLGKRDEDGYVHIVGRNKDLIITGGFNVYPKELELLIDEIEGVLESAVIGLPHKDFGEGVTAIVVPEKNATLDAKTIATAIGSKLAKFKQPKKIIIVDELPRNTMGKVQKNVLRETYKDALG